MQKLSIFFILILCTLSYNLIAQNQLGADLLANGLPNNFGRAVALDSIGHRVAIGSSYNSTLAEYAGQVKVFDYLDSNWIQVGQDLNGLGWHDYFGKTVSLNATGNILVVNVSQEGISGGGGYVKIFQLIDTLWQQMGSDIINPMEPYGQPIDINSSGSRIIIGSNSNYARIFEWNSEFSDWVQMGSTLLGNDNCSPPEYFGRQVAIDGSGNRIVIGADNYDINCNQGSDAGRVAVYEWDGSDWNQLGQSLYGVNLDYFGISVDISGNGSRIACGAPNPFGNGRVFTFDYNEDIVSWEIYGETIMGSEDDHLGRDVNLSYNGCYISCAAMENSNTESGRAQRYRLISSNWITDGEDIFGAASYQTGAGRNGTLAINSNGNIVALGSPSVNGGICRVYEYSPEPDTTVIASACSNIEFNGAFYDSTGIYLQSITSVNNCDSLIELHLTINYLDSTIVEAAGELSSNQNDVSYQWYDCDTGIEIPGANEQSFIPDVSGNYAVLLSNDECEISSECVNVQSVSISELKDNYLKVYPNPVGNKIYFDQEISGELTIWTSDGRIIKKENVNQILEFKITGISKGIYFLHIGTNDKQLKSKFIVM